MDFFVIIIIVEYLVNNNFEINDNNFRRVNNERIF